MKHTTLNLRTLFTFGAMFVVLGVFGQSRQLSFGGGLKLSALRDQAFSPLAYSGSGYEGFVGYHSLKERKETFWLLSFGKANLSSNFDRNLTTNAIRLTNLNFYSKDENAKFKWGWANNNGFHHRLIDDFQNFNGRVDFFTTFGPAGNYNLPFSLGNKNFKFQTLAHIQLLGFYLPSGYVASLPSGFGYESNSFMGSVFESMRFFHPANSFNTALWPRLEWQLKTGNNIALNYLYEYTFFSDPHRSVRSSGHWFITFNMAIK